MRRRSLQGTSLAILAAVTAYVALAYLVVPALWSWRLGDAPRDRRMVTVTKQGIPGDPINIGLVGERIDIVRAFAAADWSPADAVTLRSSLDIGESVILDRPYADAPVSPLFFDGRRQDLAFEKADGTSADRRNHIRLWRTSQAGIDGRPLWLGSASFDRGVGISYDTGQITHHIAPDIDAERDLVIDDLKHTGMVVSVESVEGRGPTQNGRNGGGDPYFTDGMATVAVLKP